MQRSPIGLMQNIKTFMSQFVAEYQSLKGVLRFYLFLKVVDN
jgi:hypothetical protein